MRIPTVRGGQKKKAAMKIDHKKKTAWTVFFLSNESLEQIQLFHCFYLMRKKASLFPVITGG